MAAAADVPTKFDVVINGQGYVFADTQDVKAEFGVTPTFVPRQNVQGDYGDNQQDFWLTATQRDWSLGEQQRYFRGAKDDDSARRYFSGKAVDITVPGQATLRPAMQSTTFGSAPVACIGGGQYSNFASATNLFQVAADGTVTDKGAHGVGATPDRYAMAVDADGQQIFISSITAGSVGIRRWGGSFSTFSATKCSALAVLNNTLYGLGDGLTGSLLRFDTAGAATTLFSWKLANGSSLWLRSKFLAFGGKLMIVRGLANALSPCELWLFDGTAPAIVARLPSNFVAYEACEALGTIFIAGVERRRAGTVAAIYYYSNGTLGLLWRTDPENTSSGDLGLASFDGRVVFLDPQTSHLMMYDPSNGGVHTIGTVGTAGTPNLLAASSDGGVDHVGNGATTGTHYPGANPATSGEITTSLFDLESSLTKRFHAIRVDFVAGNDGDGGSVDLYYYTEDFSTKTLLASDVNSGQEYELTNITGRNISVVAALNKGTSSFGPTLKRIAVRASAINPTFDRASYILNCCGTKRKPASMVELRDGGRHGKTGLEMVADLKTAAASQAPISITDAVNGTFTGLIDGDTLKIQAVRRDEYLVTLSVREV